MADYDRKQKWMNWYRRSPFRFDVLLLVFLLVGWSLIFGTATLGLQRNYQQWLPVELISQVSADYRVNTDNAKLARIEPEIIEAVKQDQILRATPTPSVETTVDASVTPTVELTVTPSPVLGPLVVSAGGPYLGDEGSDIVVKANIPGSLLDIVPGTTTYLWDLDDDGRYDDAVGASTSIVFYDEGEYTIGVQAGNLLGQAGVDTATITVRNVPPAVEIIGSEIRTKESEEESFLATATDPGHDILFYEWDFGDGSPRVTDTLNPHHTYIDDGDFTVRLTVKDNDGGVAEASISANVENLPPLVDAGSDQVTNEADRVTFQGEATDPSPVDTLTYAWDFDYDGSNFNTDATGQTASVVYPNGPAFIIAALRVRDKDEGETIDTIRVTVNNVPPVITGVSNDGPVGEGSPLSLTVSATDVGNDPLSYAYDWENDGSFEANQPDTVSHIFFNQGDFTVRIRVDDGDGGQAFTSTTVSILNEPPIAIANAETNRFEGSPVAFDGTDSSDPGLNDVLTYQWAFGDGAVGSGITSTHTYADNSVYNATLTVTDDSGLSSTASTAVNILNANPTADAGPDLTIDECQQSNNSYNCSFPITFNGAANDPGTADLLTYSWDFGDGSPLADGASATYIYPSLDGPKEYGVTLWVRDDDYNPNPLGGNEIGEAFDSLKLTVNNVSPWNVNAGGPYTGVETLPVSLTGTAEDAPADVPDLTYAWDLDSNPDFETSGSQVPYTWNAAGSYTVRLQVKDNDGGEGFASAQVTIQNALPHAQANGPYTTTVKMPLTLSSAGSSDPTNDPLTYGWDFGDGTPMVVTTSITVTHSYTDDGIYTATLKVDDSRGGTDLNSARVTVLNLPPTAVASANPTTVTKGNPVTFDGSGSTDPDDNPATLNYQWNFGDGSSANGINASHTYVNRGTYTATLIVTDDNGASSNASVVITVNNSPPIAQAGPPNQTVNEGGQLTFDGSGSSDPDNDPLTYQWDFGDGTPVANGVSVTHPYQDGPATYVVTLTVTDNDGSTATDTVQVTVNNVAPTVDAGPPSQTLNEGTPFTFNGSASDPGSDTLTYQWNFGDGSPAANGNPVTYSYPNGPANFTLTLTVTDSDGSTGTDTAQITVNNVAPTAVAVADQTAVTVGQPVNFDGSGSNDPGPDTLTFQWDFGDGITDNSGPIVSHAWTITGTYTIILLVDDGDGGSGTATVSVQVN